MSVEVIVAVAGPREADIAAALTHHQGLNVVRRCVDLTEAMGVAHAGLGSVAVVSEHKDLDRNALAQLQGLGLVVVGAPSTPDAASHLRGLGLTHIVLEPDEPQLWFDVITAATARPDDLAAVAELDPEPVPATAGCMIAVWGPTGAPGRTTVAVNVAAELAQLGHNVILADVDTYGGAVHHGVGLLDEAPGMAALARASLHGNLGPHSVLRHALVVSAGLRVLTGISRPERWAELSGPSLDGVWPVLRQEADVTVVDCGFGLESDEILSYDTHAPQRNGAALSAIGHADVVIGVSSAEPLGVQRFVTAVTRAFGDGVLERGRLLPVANKVPHRTRRIGHRHDVADAFARHLDMPQTWLVPWDQHACATSQLAGQTLAECAPRSRARHARRALAAAAVERAAAPAPMSESA